MGDKFELFLSITKELNRLGINPVLFGSLSVAVVTNQSIVVNDIDILIPDKWLEDKWLDLVLVMKNIGFKIHNKSEHEFTKDNQIVGFAGESALEDIALSSKDLKLDTENGSRYFILTAKQLLSVYEYSLDDGYRLDKRDDRFKIDLLKKYI